MGIAPDQDVAAEDVEDVLDELSEDEVDEEELLSELLLLSDLDDDLLLDEL
ncbi:hypothetical protein [Polyangium jinanense]|uniref:hypothetical protein n=1 Tax=Polyangium jinanense TaxID=2829994 RepID=UPI00233F8AD2|nr:hypothetical protein [Polyangium jinanense]